MALIVILILLIAFEVAALRTPADTRPSIFDRPCRSI